MPNRLVGEVIGQRSFPTTDRNASVRDAAVIMKEWHSSAILIVESGYLVGICTERDIVFRVVAGGCNPAQTSVGTVMTRNPRTVGPEKPFGHALHLMYEGGFRHMPVVDRVGHPIGLLAAHDALDMDGLQMEQDLVRREEITVIL
jgi:CBS domain-containing protein